MSADDQVTSLTGVGESADNTGHAHLPRRTGAWCWKHKANRRQHKKRSKNFAALIGDLFIASFGEKALRPEEAEDLTQSFFALLLERRNFDAVRKEKGRLRSYLLTSLKHFLVSEHRRAVTLKRGKGQQPVPLDELSGAERSDMEPADHLTAERIYERRWALTLMEQVLGRLKDEYCTAGNAVLFDSLKQLLPTNRERRRARRCSMQLGITDNALRQALHRFRQRYQLLLREEISHTVAIASDVEDELRHLITVLRT